MLTPHTPERPKYLSRWFVCMRCGLVYLNNDISRAAIKYGCDYRDDPSYQRIERKIRNDQKR